MTTEITTIRDETHGRDGSHRPEDDWGARWPYSLVAGALCLEFANTLGDRPTTPSQEEDLRDYADLLTWAERMRVLPTARVAALRAWAAAHPDAAATTYAGAITLRETVYRVFAAVAVGDAPAPDDRARLTAAYRGAMAHVALVPAADGFAWNWDDTADAPEAMLWPVTRSAAELLVAPERARVRHCAGADCSWLFLDTTKNGSRHWCSMKGCGNRAKARRFRARHHDGHAHDTT